MQWKFLHKGYFFLGCTFFITECWLFFLSWENNYNPVFFFLSHFLSTLYLMNFYRLRAQGDYKLWFWKIAGLCLCMPFLGFFFAIVITPHLEEMKAEFIDDFDEHVVCTLENVKYIPDEEHRNRIVTEKGNVFALVDLLSKDGFVEQKIKELKTIPEHPNAKIIQMIKKATSDKSQEVKYIAASVLKKIEKPLIDEINDLSKKLRKNPKDSSLLVELGNHCFNYCYLELPENSSIVYYLNWAYESYKSALELLPDRSDLLLAIGKTLVKLKKGREAIHYLDQYINKAPEDCNGYIWKAEAYYETRDFISLRKFLSDESLLKVQGWDQFRTVQAVWK